MKLLFCIFLMSCLTKSYCQFFEKHKNVYLHNEKKLFTVEWNNKSKKNKSYIDTLKSLDLIVVENNGCQHITYLGEDWSIHFLTLDKDTNLILSYRYIEDEQGKKFFPKSIHLLEQSKFSNDILAIFSEGEGPIFQVLIFRWDNNKSIKKVYNSRKYFFYPSWNPLIERKNVKIIKNEILIPYCDGCESGKDGTLKWDTLIYNDDYTLIK